MADPSRPYIRFDEIRTKLAWHDIFEAFGILDNFQEKDGVYTGTCPLPQHVHGNHPDRQQFKADTRKDRPLYRCFGDCAAHDYGGGDLVSFVKAMTGLDDSQVRFWFAERFSHQLTTTKPAKKKEPPVRQEPEATAAAPATDEEALPERTSRQPDGQAPLDFALKLDLPAAAPCLKARGISMDTAKRYGLGICSKRSKMFAGYLCAPIYRWPKESADEKPVGYYGRLVAPDDEDEAETRPRHKLGCQTRHLLFGLEQALACTPDHQALLLHEGPLKTVWFADRGWTNSISSFTAGLTDEQVDLIQRVGRPMVIAFDGDQKGREATRAALGKLITKCLTAAVKLPENVQPDELTDDDLELYFARWRPS